MGERVFRPPVRGPAARMNILTDRGLVLRRVRHLENDVRLTLLLRETGKVLAVSKGGRRFSSKLKSVQEPFTEADFHVFLAPHGFNARLMTAQLVNTYFPLRGHVDAFETASRCCETVDVLLPFRAASPDVFDILQCALAAMCATKQPRREWVVFVVRLMRTLGHGDFTEAVLDVIEPAERAMLETALHMGPRREGMADLILSPISLGRSTAFVEKQLEQVLPWRLKSDAVNLAAEPPAKPYRPS
jgi:hypothetical protein